MKKLKLIPATMMFLLGSTAFADCKIDEVKKGWTGSIKFNCDTKTNLVLNPIKFKLSNDVEVGSIWGLSNTKMTRNGSSVSITSQNWNGNPTILKAGSSATMSFSPSAPVFDVQNFSIGNGASDPVDPVDPVDPPSGDYPAYVENTTYISGSIVEHNGRLYKSKTGLATECSDPAWAYAPKTGTAWDLAWSLYDPANSDDPIDPTIPTDTFETAQADLDKKEDTLSSGPMIDKVKESIKTRDNAVVEAVEPSLQSNPENVKRVEGIISSNDWNFLFPKRAPEYTYSNFLKAVAKFPAFCGNYDDGRDANASCRKSLATMFAHFAQETGGHTAHWDVPEWRQALVHVREMGWSETMRGGYNGECNLDVWQGQTWMCGTFANGDFKSYFGRGAKQLSYNYNYGPFSQAIYGDVKVLLDNPELVAYTWLNLASAVFFFVYPQPPKPSMLHVIDGTWQPNVRDIANGLTPGFGITTQIINGGVECVGSVEIAQSINRRAYYDNLTKKLGVAIPNDEVRGCKLMKQFDAEGAGAMQIYWE